MTDRYTTWLQQIAERDWALLNFVALALVVVLVWEMAVTFPAPFLRLTRWGVLLGFALAVFNTAILILSNGRAIFAIVFSLVVGVGGAVAYILARPIERKE